LSPFWRFCYSAPEVACSQGTGVANHKWHGLDLNREADDGLKMALFTLIELLVVIGILGILCSLLMPVLKSVRDMSRSTVCMNNLKQIGLAIVEYANDNNSYPPRIWLDGVSSSYWHQQLIRNEYLAGPVLISGPGDEPRPGVLQCPVENFSNGGKSQTGSWWSGTHYGINSWITGGSTISAWSHMLTLDKNPAERYLILDAYWAGASTIGQSAFRHKTKVNILFTDGHVDGQNTLPASAFDVHWGAY